MTLYMPPVSRKKKVPQKYDPDTWRLFNSHVEDRRLMGDTHNNQTFQGRPPKNSVIPQPRPASSSRKHRPHPKGVEFLRQNVAALHEPICHVRSARIGEEHWWPAYAGDQQPKLLPKYSHETTSRAEFLLPEEQPEARKITPTRHGCNPNVVAANGIVPINQLPSKRGPRLLLEHISYDHQYNCRNQPSQPHRGKLHGSFVWNTLHPVAPGDEALPERPTIDLSPPSSNATVATLHGNENSQGPGGLSPPSGAPPNNTTGSSANLPLVST